MATQATLYKFPSASVPRKATTNVAAGTSGGGGGGAGTPTVTHYASSGRGSRFGFRGRKK